MRAAAACPLGLTGQLACRHPNAVLVEVKNYRYSPDDPDIENSGEFVLALCYAAVYFSTIRTSRRLQAVAIAIKQLATLTP